MYFADPTLYGASLPHKEFQYQAPFFPFGMQQMPWQQKQFQPFQQWQQFVGQQIPPYFAYNLPYGYQHQPFMYGYPQQQPLMYGYPQHQPFGFNPYSHGGGQGFQFPNWQRPF